MFEPTFKLMIDGKEASPEDFGDAIKSKVYDHLRQRIAEKLRGVRCPEHGNAPEVTAEGSNLDSLKWKVFGCCDKLREEAQKALREN